MKYKSPPRLFYSYSEKVEFKCTEVLEAESALVKKDEKDQSDIIWINFEVYKFDLLIYAPYMLVNKTDQILYFGDKTSKKDNLT